MMLNGILTSHCSATRGLLATDHVILNHGQVTWTTPELAPPLLTTTPHQREDVSALDRFNGHRCPTRWVFSGTGLEPVTKQATVRYLYHSATAATQQKKKRRTAISLKGLTRERSRGAQSPQAHEIVNSGKTVYLFPMTLTVSSWPCGDFGGLLMKRDEERVGDPPLVFKRVFLGDEGKSPRERGGDFPDERRNHERLWRWRTENHVLERWASALRTKD
ncbi:uncharacterized protein TNCV_1780161 [Trichonephila clavipes]|nr:uncharacterized protein TNCV_1780161 [Trichonephila clavipes]